MSLYRWFVGGKSWSDQDRLRRMDAREDARARKARKARAKKSAKKSGGKRKNLGLGLYWE